MCLNGKRVNNSSNYLLKQIEYSSLCIQMSKIKNKFSQAPHLRKKLGILWHWTIIIFHSPDLIGVESAILLQGCF